MGSIGKWIIKQEWADFGSRGKGEVHFTCAIKKKVRVSHCSQALNTMVRELADWKTKDCALLPGLRGRGSAGENTIARG